ncbi:MAG: alpha/beta fold hydrolase [Moorea sp. SIO2B7]|nr:alpha/beta fold hydrolase [Moorena sp. SIO2B7]
MKMTSDYTGNSQSDLDGISYPVREEISYAPRNPVLLIHGIYDTIAVFKKMSAYLTNLGWSVHCFNLTPNNGTFALEQLASQIADYIATNFAPEQPLDLIGFSMGGIVTRYYLQRLGGMNRVQRYINISAPNNGTLIAYALPHLGIVQMRPESAFLEDLNRDGEDIWTRVNLTVMWTPLDLMIVPAKSSQMSVGKELKFPVLLHSWMLNNAKVLAAVADALSEPIKSDRQLQSTHDHQKLLQNDGRI